jgi:hypothetical protein
MTRLTIITDARIARSSAFTFATLLCTCAALAQRTLQITSPAEGTVVRPGQTITVTVTVSSGGVFMGVG